MSKLKPCTNGKRHKWEWMTNGSVVKSQGQRVTISMRGVYLCACGQTKMGAPGHG